MDFCWASSPEEYRALAKHVIVLVSVVTQDEAELPLRRVYVNIDGRETELIRLSSQRSGVRRGSITYLDTRSLSRGRLLYRRPPAA